MTTATVERTSSDANPQKIRLQSRLGEDSLDQTLRACTEGGPVLPDGVIDSPLTGNNRNQEDDYCEHYIVLSIDNNHTTTTTNNNTNKISNYNMNFFFFFFFFGDEGQGFGEKASAPVPTHG